MKSVISVYAGQGIGLVGYRGRKDVYRSVLPMRLKWEKPETVQKQVSALYEALHVAFHEVPIILETVVVVQPASTLVEGPRFDLLVETVARTFAARYGLTVAMHAQPDGKNLIAQAEANAKWALQHWPLAEGL